MFTGPIIYYDVVETRIDAREFVGLFDPQCHSQCGILQRRQNCHFQRNPARLVCADSTILSVKLRASIRPFRIVGGSIIKTRQCRFDETDKLFIL